MFRLIIAGAASALCLAASPAAAEPFANFVDMCLETDADGQAAGARAKAIGWTPLPAQAAAEIEMQDAAVYFSADPADTGGKGPPADLEVLATGSGSGEEVFDISGVRLDACIVMTFLGASDTFAERLEEMLGFAPMDFDGEAAWAFSRGGAGVRSEANVLESAGEDPDAVRRLARERKIFVAAVIMEEGMTGLMLAALRPDQ